MVLQAVLWSMFPVTALAQTSASGQAEAPPVPPSKSRPELEQQFLRVAPSPWSPFGFRLSKNGQPMGPNLFSVVPDAAVSGSEEAMVHVRHARIYQGFTVGTAFTGVGLILGGFVVANQHDRWTPAARLLTAGGVLAILGELFCALGRAHETLEAVNAYNYDLVRGPQEPAQ
jgi:hypothetical protein